jgi:restriction system protein
VTRAWSKPKLPRPILGGAQAAAAAGAALLLLSNVAAGQETSKTYYHVEQVTTGCQNPAATRLLTNPDQTAQADARRLRSIRSSGHCVTITPRSQWSFLWRENDMAMMSYAGTTGRPGSYYLRIDDLVDAEGRHPGGWEADPISGQSSSPGQAAEPWRGAERPAQTGGVPTIVPSATLPPQIAAANPPSGTLDELIAKNGGLSQALSPEHEAAGPTEPDGAASRFWVPGVALAVVVGALGAFTVLRRRQARPPHSEPALQLAIGEIQAQALALREAKAESTRPDRFGTVHADGWQREKVSFVSSRIAPRLRDAGYDTVLPSLLPVIDSVIERHANSLVEPASTETDRQNGNDDIATSEVDAELSSYASRCTALLHNAGWTTDPNPVAYGKAVDILAERDGRKLLLQCKAGTAPIGVEAVQQVHTLKDRRHADIAAIVSSAPFTRAAHQMASANGVHALHDEDLTRLIQ